MKKKIYPHRVLIIDDLQDAQMLLRKMMETLGFEYIEALNSAEKALRMIAEGSCYDIILCDYNMGERMNGQQFLEELVSQKMVGYGTIFIMATAETSREMVISAMECRPDAYLAKPFNLKILESHIFRLLKEKKVLSRVIEADKEDRKGEAIEICQNLVSDQSNPSIKLRRFFAELLTDYGMFEDALEAYSECMTVSKPDWARLGCAKVLIGLNRLDDATKELDRLVETITTEMPTYDLLAEINLKQQKPDEAQLVLEKALALSPNTFTRQRVYSQLCLDNGDTDKAVRAGKHAIKLGRFTSNATSDNLVTLAQAQMAHAKRLDDDGASKLIGDAEKNLDMACKDETSSGWVHISHRMGQAIRAEYLHLPEDSRQHCEHAISLIVNIDSLTEREFPMIINCVKNLQDLGHQKEAATLVDRLGKAFHNNASILGRLDRISKYPLSTSGKKKVSEINKVGIDLYESGDFQAAIKNFEMGTCLFPNCVEFHLNYVLAAVSMMEEKALESALLKDCRARLQLVRSVGVSEKIVKKIDKLENRLGKLTRSC